MNSGSSRAVLADVALMNAPRIVFRSMKAQNNKPRRSPIHTTSESDILLARPVTTRALAMMNEAMLRIMTGCPNWAKAGFIFIVPVKITSTMAIMEVR